MSRESDCKLYNDILRLVANHSRTLHKEGRPKILKSFTMVWKQIADEWYFVHDGFTASWKFPKTKKSKNTQQHGDTK